MFACFCQLSSLLFGINLYFPFYINSLTSICKEPLLTYSPIHGTSKKQVPASDESRSFQHPCLGFALLLFLDLITPPEDVHNWGRLFLTHRVGVFTLKLNLKLVFKGFLKIHYFQLVWSFRTLKLHFKLMIEFHPTCLACAALKSISITVGTSRGTSLPTPRNP